MSKLPNIFHNNTKFYTNNKNSFNTFEKVKEIKKKDNIDTDVDLDNLFTYINKKVIITLKDGSTYSGIMISKRNNKILLDSNDSILIDDILKIN